MAERGQHPRRDPPRSRRRRRWDAGATLTARDMAALRWLGEQYGARSDVLLVLLGRLSPGGTQAPGILGPATLRQVLSRWDASNLVERHRLLGWQWVLPTAKALRLVGLDLPSWRPVITQLAHVHAVGILRLALEPTIPGGARWVSERVLRRESGTARTPDGAIELPKPVVSPQPAVGTYGEVTTQLPPRVALEVELTRKSAERLREILNRPRHQRYVRTTYYAPRPVASYLEGQIARIQPRHRVEIRALPIVAGTTYFGDRV